MIFPLAFGGGKAVWPIRICAPLLFLAMALFNGLAVFQFPAKASGTNYDFLTPPWIVLGVGALAVMIFVLNRSKSARGGGVKNFAFVLFFVSVLFLIFNFFANRWCRGHTKIWERRLKYRRSTKLRCANRRRPIRQSRQNCGSSRFDDWGKRHLTGVGGRLYSK